MDSTPVRDPETVQGELGLGTLPALIRQLHEDRRTGTLHIRTGGSLRRVHFQWGAVVFAGSERRDDRLDQRLRREGLADRATLQAAHEAQRASGKRFGECLIEMGVLSEAELLAAVERQVRSIVTFLFSLDRGQYSFEETDDPVEQDLALDLPMREIIVDGIRSMEDPIALRIGVGSMTHYLHAGLTSENANVNAAEGFVLSRVDGRTNVLDILAVSPLDEVETLRSICALLAVGIVVAKPDALDTSAPRPEPPKQKPKKSEAKKSEPKPQKVAVAELPNVDVEAPEDHEKTLAEDERARAGQRFQEGRRLYADGKFYEAIGALLEAVRLDDEQARYHRLLGRAYARNPKWRASAIEHFQRAIELDEYDEGTYLSLGEVYELDGREEDARRAFQRVLSLDPSHPRAREKLKKKSVVSRLKSMFKRTST